MFYNDDYVYSELTINQAENERGMINTSKMLLILLEKFISVVTSDAITNTLVQPEI
jgi:hypothetical protein